MSASVELPRYARWASSAGRPLVLVAALAMSAPGEFHLALLAGWSRSVAWLMPVSVSVYAGVAAVIAATRPKGMAGRASALVGAGVALALAAQVVAHLITAGYMATSAFLVAATSAVPPVVVAHMLHLAAHPATDETVALLDQAVAVAGELEDVAKAAMTTPEAEVDTPDQEVAVLTLAAPLVAVEDVATPPAKEAKAAKAAKAPARTLAEIQAAVEYLVATGQPVNGTTYAAHVGVSTRTARRDLAALEDMAATAA